MDKKESEKKSNWTNIFFLLFFFGTIAFIIIAPIYIVDKIDKESKLPRHKQELIRKVSSKEMAD